MATSCHGEVAKILFRPVDAFADNVPRHKAAHEYWSTCLLFLADARASDETTIEELERRSVEAQFGVKRFFNCRDSPELPSAPPLLAAMLVHQSLAGPVSASIPSILECPPSLGEVSEHPYDPVTSGDITSPFRELVVSLGPLFGGKTQAAIFHCDFDDPLSLVKVITRIATVIHSRRGENVDLMDDPLRAPSKSNCGCGCVAM